MDLQSVNKLITTTIIIPKYKLPRLMQNKLMVFYYYYLFPFTKTKFMKTNTQKILTI